MAAKARCGPESAFCFHTWVAGAQVPRSFSIVFPVPLLEIESGAAGMPA